MFYPHPNEYEVKRMDKIMGNSNGVSKMMIDGKPMFYCIIDGKRTESRRASDIYDVLVKKGIM